MKQVKTRHAEIDMAVAAGVDAIIKVPVTVEPEKFHWWREHLTLLLVLFKLCNS
jgi:hypothetical protein